MKAAIALLTLITAYSATAEDKITYTKDIAPIFYANCVDCHRPGEIAPFSLMDYDTIRPWAKSIRKVVHEKSMPPWHADSEKTEFLNDRSLSEEEIAKILNWVDQGSPRGRVSDMPTAPVFHDTWAMGDPDFIFHAERDFEVPAFEQKIPYQPIWFITDIKEDLYITGWEIRPTERSTVHHANLAHQPKRTESVGITEAIFAGGAYIGSYLPGARPFSYPEGTALMIPKGSQIGISVHYVGQDEPITDHMMFGVKFAQGRVDKVIRSIGTYHTKFDIAPGEADYVVETEATLLRPMTIHSSGIHMHLRGSAYTASVTLPDGTTQLIADVPSFDFNWQTNYELANPINVPKGTKYHIRAVWDNSDNNPINPDPSLRIRYGRWTDDEMLNTWSHATLNDENLGLEIKDGHVVSVHPDASGSPKAFLVQTLPVQVNASSKENKTD